MEAGKAVVCEYPEAEDMVSLWVKSVETRCGQAGTGQEPSGCECPALPHSPSEPEWQPSETGSELEDPVGLPHRCGSSSYRDGMEWWEGPAHHGMRARKG